MFETTALTVLEMLDRGAPDAPALLAPGRGPMTFGALRDNVCRLAERLAVLGFGRNDRIAIVMENGPDLVLALLAAASCGTAVPLNPKYRTDEFGFYFGDASAKGLIVTPGAFPDALAAVTPGMTVIHAIAGPSGELRLDPVGPARPARSLEAPGPDDIAILLHTSGTTKLPKRVPIRHRNLAASAGNVVRTYGLTPDDISLCVMPLFHIHGICASLLAPLTAGGPVVCPRRSTRCASGAGWMRSAPPGTRPSRRCTSCCWRAPNGTRTSSGGTRSGSSGRAVRRWRRR